MNVQELREKQLIEESEFKKGDKVTVEYDNPIFPAQVAFIGNVYIYAGSVNYDLNKVGKTGKQSKAKFNPMSYKYSIKKT